MLADLVSSEASFLGLQVAPSCCVLFWPFSLFAPVSLPLLIRTLVLLDEDPTLVISFNLNYPLKILQMQSR